MIGVERVHLFLQTLNFLFLIIIPALLAFVLLFSIFIRCVRNRIILHVIIFNDSLDSTFFLRLFSLFRIVVLPIHSF